MHGEGLRRVEDAYPRVVELAKRRGFFWAAYEIYGGAGGFYVLGDLGVKVKERIADLWRRMFVSPYGFLMIDAPTIAPHVVFKASGHVDNFKDPMAECVTCGRKYRADHLLKDSGISITEGAPISELEGLLNGNGVKCPECGSAKWRAKPFLTMFETRIGPYSDDIGFLRPETAQNMFVEFKRVFEISRGKLPLGIAQIGRGFRNEISPRQAMIRLREFNMMELELFIDPESKCPYVELVSEEELPIVTEDMAARGELRPRLVKVGEALSNGLIVNDWLAYFLVVSKKFLVALGVPEEYQRFHGKPEGERAHYSSQTFDHEVLIPGLGWVEVAGLSYRTDFDLRAHIRHSRRDLSVSIPLQQPVERKIVSWRVRDPKEVGSVLGDKAGRLLEIVEKHKHDENLPEIIKDELSIEANHLLVREERSVVEHTKRIVPHVVEPSYGLERLIVASLAWAYRVKEERVVLSLPPYIAPIQAAVFPLVTKDGLPEKAKMVATTLREEGFEVYYDETGSIGRRYARADEIGVPYAVTIDYQTLRDDTVTIRFRDTWEQRRVEVKELPEELRRLLKQPVFLPHAHFLR